MRFSARNAPIESDPRVGDVVVNRFEYPHHLDVRRLNQVVL
jgi:hypothetical protein